MAIHIYQVILKPHQTIHDIASYVVTNEHHIDIQLKVLHIHINTYTYMFYGILFQGLITLYNLIARSLQPNNTTLLFSYG